MEYGLKKRLMDRAQYIANHIGEKAALLIAAQEENVLRDFNKTVEDLTETKQQLIFTEVENLNSVEGEKLVVADVLDAHVDTLVKTMLNVIVSALTEIALEKVDVTWEGVDLVEYALSRKEEYGIL